jgi:tetratricopeptide (TPR) repeat protein
MGISGADRILLVDDLFAHAEYAAAYDLALYLASSRDLYGLTLSKSGLDEALGRICFLRLLAILAAIQGGLYHRARTSLVRVEQLLPSVDKTDDVSRVLRGNYELLWGRLAQVQSLPIRALEHFQNAKDIFLQTRCGLPRGVDLLDSRSQLRAESTEIALSSVVGNTPRLDRNSLFGMFEAHYRSYLLARAAFEKGDWETALEKFDDADSELRLQSHDGLIDPIRGAYIKMGIARTIIGRAAQPPGKPRELESGLNALLEAQSVFRKHHFTPGEFVAHRHFCLAKVGGSDDNTSLQLLKTVSSVGRMTGVLRFQLEADLLYAQALYRYGRPNAARAAINYINASEHDEFSAELVDTRLWREVTSLKQATNRALDNAVEPLEPWGISDYATREREFVESASESDIIISAYGSAGSGRRLFLERISEARGCGSNLVVVTGGDREMKGKGKVAEIVEHLSARIPVILYDFNEWAVDTQDQVILAVANNPQYAKRTYLTLTRPLADAQIGSQLAPRVESTLTPGAWMIDPLSTRREDTLLLARGFLVRTLRRSGGAKKEDPKRLIFTSNSARYLKTKYSHIGDLYRAMRFFAYRLRMQYDVLHESDGHLKVPLEAIERYLTTPPDSTDMSVALASGKDRVHLGQEIKQADSVTVQKLAKQFGGRLSKLAIAAGIPRSTLIRYWQKDGLMDAWHDAGGREARSGRKR